MATGIQIMPHSGFGPPLPYRSHIGHGSYLRDNAHRILSCGQEFPLTYVDRPFQAGSYHGRG